MVSYIISKGRRGFFLLSERIVERNLNMKNANLIKKVFEIYVFFIHLHSDNIAARAVVVTQTVDLQIKRILLRLCTGH